MAKVLDGKTFDEDWHEIDAMGNRIGDGKDWAANAAYASKTGTQNPYTNQAGSSPWDKSGMIPGNEPGSQLQPVQAQIAPAATAAASNPFNDAVQQRILDELARPAGVNQTDPAFVAQNEANRIQSKRAADHARQSTVARMHAQGQGDSGAMDGAIAGIASKRGEQDSMMHAQLMQSTLQAERERVARALQLGVGVMSNNQQLALQERLANLDASIRRSALDLQRYLGTEDINLRRDGMANQFAFNLADLNQRAFDSLWR